MTRYIRNLPMLDDDILIDLYERGVQDIDSSLGDENVCSLTTGQLHFIRTLLERRGVVVREIEDITSARIGVSE